MARKMNIKTEAILFDIYCFLVRARDEQTQPKMVQLYTERVEAQREAILALRRQREQTHRPECARLESECARLYGLLETSVENAQSTIANMEAEAQALRHDLQFQNETCNILAEKAALAEMRYGELRFTVDRIVGERRRAIGLLCFVTVVMLVEAIYIGVLL